MSNKLRPFKQSPDSCVRIRTYGIEKRNKREVLDTDVSGCGSCENHSGLSRDKLDQAIENWAGNPKTNFAVFCTEGFGVGLDASNVRTVVGAGGSRSLVDFWQVAGVRERWKQIPCESALPSIAFNFSRRA